MTITLAVLAALAIGYAVGRAQPAPRLLNWAEDQRRGTLRFWPAQLVLMGAVLFLLCTRPRSVIRTWKHRNDPPVPLTPAVTFDPNWAEKRRAEAEADAELDRRLNTLKEKP